jgi:hypothetical protein
MDGITVCPLMAACDFAKPAVHRSHALPPRISDLLVMVSSSITAADDATADYHCGCPVQQATRGVYVMLYVMSVSQCCNVITNKTNSFAAPTQVSLGARLAARLQLCLCVGF